MYPSSIHDTMLTDRILWKPCADNHSCNELMHATAPSCMEDVFCCTSPHPLTLKIFFTLFGDGPKAMNVVIQMML